MLEKQGDSQQDARARDNGAPGLSVLRSEGQRALRLVPGSLAAIAASTGTNKATVSRWRSGEKVPNAAARQRLCELYAIPLEAWERAPLGAEPMPTASVSEAPSNRPQTSIEITRQRLDRLYAALDRNPSLPDYIKIEAQIGDATKELRLAESASELQEARIVLEHKKFKAIVRGLVEVLRPFPAAAEAAAAWLADFEDA